MLIVSEYYCGMIMVMSRMMMMLIMMIMMPMMMMMIPMMGTVEEKAEK